MKFVSLDIETTGTESELDQIIEIGCVFVDTDTKIKKEFYKVLSHKRYSGSAFALGLNQRIFNILAGGFSNDIIQIESLKYHLEGWLKMECGYRKEDEIILAGKNVAKFDFPFLKKAWPEIENYFKISYRSLDPAMLYLDINDRKVPSLEECKKRAGYENTEVSHNALEDAKDVVNLILDYYNANFDVEK